MLQILTLSLVVLGAQPPVDVLAVSPKLEADALTIGPEYEIVLRVAIKDGWPASGAGVPAPLLQIDAPPAVKLSGKTLSSYQELSRNEFLQAPFEHLLQIGDVAADFSLSKAFDPPPSLGQYLGQKNIVVTTYRAHW